LSEGECIADHRITIDSLPGIQFPDQQRKRIVLVIKRISDKAGCVAEQASERRAGCTDIGNAACS